MENIPKKAFEGWPERQYITQSALRSLRNMKGAVT